MRSFTSPIILVAAIGAAPAVAQAPAPPPERVVATVRQDVSPHEQTVAMRADVPVERVDRPIVRTRHSDERGLLRREFALLAF